MRRGTAIVGLIVFVITAGFRALPARAATQSPPLVQVINTFAWPKPFPDPMGLSYNPATGRLLLADSKVVSTDLWRGVNYVELTATGQITYEANISKCAPEGQCATNEDVTRAGGLTNRPSSVEYDVANDRYFVSEDNKPRRIYEVDPGSDGYLGSSDDTVRSFPTTGFTSEGGEGLAYGAGSLFVATGGDQKVCRLQAGADGLFNGVPSDGGDDTVTCFSTVPLGIADPEGLDYEEATGHLFIASRKNDAGQFVVETTAAGTLVNTYNLTGTTLPFRPSGIVIAPGTTSSRAMWLISRGADMLNGSTTGNDGRLYEYRLGEQTQPGNSPPVVSKPADQVSEAGETVTPLQIVATDPDGDAMTYDATGLPHGLAIGSSTGLITGEVQTLGSSTVSVTVNDGRGGSTVVQFKWTVTGDSTPPAKPGPLTIARHTTGLFLDWPGNTEPDLAGYEVARSESAAGPYVKINSARLTMSEFFDTGARAGITSYYRVWAVDHAGNPSASQTGIARRSKIVFVSGAVAKSQGLTLIMPRPAGTVPGDVLIAGVAARNSLTIIPPQGWTYVSQVAQTLSMGHQSLFSHTVAASDPVTYTFTLVGPAATVGVVAAYRGALEKPAGVAASANEASTEITAPGLVALANNAVQVGFFGIQFEAAISAPAGMLSRGAETFGVGPAGIAVLFADTVVDAAQVPARVAMASDAAVNVGQVAVLNPAP